MGDVDIKKRFAAQLKQQGATPADLDAKGVNVLAADDGKLSVLVKEKKGAPKVDKLEGEIETKAGTKAVKLTRAEEKLDLGDEYGKWTIFDIEAVNATTAIGSSEGPSVLHVLFAAAKGRGAGGRVFTPVDV